jgi:hypothetical protein
MNYVFLDIDGVFTSDRVWLGEPAHLDFMTTFDPIAIKFLNTIPDMAKAPINSYRSPVEFVISSTWKDYMIIGEMEKMWIEAAFRNAGFTGKFAEDIATPMFQGLYNGRAHEIKEYLAEHTYGDFIIFDDIDFGFDEVLGVKRLVQTSDTDGLLYKNMLHAKSIIGNWP